MNKPTETKPIDKPITPVTPDVVKPDATPQRPEHDLGDAAARDAADRNARR